MNKKEFMKRIEQNADCFTRNSKTWFSAKVVFEILKQEKNIEQVEKKLRFLKEAGR